MCRPVRRFVTQRRPDLGGLRGRPSSGREGRAAGLRPGGIDPICAVASETHWRRTGCVRRRRFAATRASPRWVQACASAASKTELNPESEGARHRAAERLRGATEASWCFQSGIESGYSSPTERPGQALGRDLTASVLKPTKNCGYSVM